MFEVEEPVDEAVELESENVEIGSCALVVGRAVWGWLGGGDELGKVEDEADEEVDVLDEDGGDDCEDCEFG